VKNTRTLYLPNGGTMEIPLPGSTARFEMNPGGALAFADGSRMPPLLLGALIGAGIGIGVTVWYLRSRR
jgi:hypothetical protein